MTSDVSGSRRAQRRLRSASRTRRSLLRDFMDGAALIFDFGGKRGQRNISTARCPSDAERMAEDWWAVGNDMRRAMGQPPVENPTS
ncbi:MAG: hypothetical protein OXH86_10680 [Acidimicrobiaceae bacterium]|nr:hypothetical protein [Acidimicrobiaceae bacterium]